MFLPARNMWFVFRHQLMVCQRRFQVLSLEEVSDYDFLTYQGVSCLDKQISELNSVWYAMNETLLVVWWKLSWIRDCGCACAQITLASDSVAVLQLHWMMLECVWTPWSLLIFVICKSPGWFHHVPYDAAYLPTVSGSHGYEWIPIFSISWPRMFLMRSKFSFTNSALSCLQGNFISFVCCVQRTPRSWYGTGDRFIAVHIMVHSSLAGALLRYLNISVAMWSKATHCAYSVIAYWGRHVILVSEDHRRRAIFCSNICRHS